MGLEPTTSRSTISRSNHLSYTLRDSPYFIAPAEECQGEKCQGNETEPSPGGG